MVQQELKSEVDTSILKASNNLIETYVKDDKFLNQVIKSEIDKLSKRLVKERLSGVKPEQAPRKPNIFDRNPAPKKNDVDLDFSQLSSPTINISSIDNEFSMSVISTSNDNPLVVESIQSQDSKIKFKDKMMKLRSNEEDAIVSAPG